MKKPRLLRITTVPMSLHLLLKGQLRFIMENGFEVETASADGPEVAEVRLEGAGHRMVPFTRKITPFRDLWCLWKLARIIREFQPDIVHTHTPKAGLIGMLAAFICRVPVRLHTVAGLPFMETSGLKKPLLVLMERITHACAHRIYINSFGLLAFMKELFPTASAKFRVLANGSSNGIDVNYYSVTPAIREAAEEIRTTSGIHKQEVVFCFVGRLVKQKGVNELVAAFEALQKDTNSWLLLVGDFEDQLDPLDPETMSRIHSNKNIIHPGFQKDIRPWMVASDIFVFPTYREGFPNVLLQAGCLGVPSIASDINGCNEIIESGSSGILIPAKSTRHLLEAMRTLAVDPENRMKLASEARRHIVTRYPRQLIWEATLAEYRSFLTVE